MAKRMPSWLMTRRVFLGLTAGLASVVVLGRKFFFKSRDPAATSAANSPVTDFKIVRASIHPGIGIARVGNSPEAYFIGPEVTEPPPTKAGDSHDLTSGALKRQAARFRIYGYNTQGQVVREITVDDKTEIQWQVHLANKKASWYRFLAALDLAEAKEMVCARRNPSLKGKDRQVLNIDPGARQISGINKRGEEFQFKGGKFKNTPVALGELRTDEAGRLLVFGGSGVSASPSNAPVFDEKNFDTFNNADDWYDDIADGPVRASLKIDGISIPVESAWVAVGPPNYSPNTIGWRTMYELLMDTYVAAGMKPMPEVTSFREDILPLLRRLSQIGWVNKGFADLFGRGKEFDFENPKILRQLAFVPDQAGSEEEAKRRREKIRQLYESFRTPENVKIREPSLWPMLYGDAFGSFEKSVHNNLIVPSLQAMHLRRWAEGDFISDWTPQTEKLPRQINEVPLQDQPAMLDKAALHFCLADAFHPGCELTWPMRHASLYRAPFRIRERAADAPEPDYGDELTQAIALSTSGPLHGQGPGDLTRWMAVPWQGDTLFCRSGYDPDVNPYLPSFWPARVPNQVLSEAEYQIVMNTGLPIEERRAAFQRRRSWVRQMKGSAADQILQMVNEFGSTGVIEARPGIAGDKDFPPVMYVETIPKPNVPAEALATPKAALSPLESHGKEDRSIRSADPVEQAGWESAAQLREFRRIRFR